MTARRVIAQPCAPRTTPVAADQIGGDAAFINEDVLPNIAERLRLAPAAPLSSDIRPSLFVGVYGFF
jgi:hypothetical protein